MCKDRQESQWRRSVTSWRYNGMIVKQYYQAYLDKDADQIWDRLDKNWGRYGAPLGRKLRLTFAPKSMLTSLILRDQVLKQ